jgi:hypothetical protein
VDTHRNRVEPTRSEAASETARRRLLVIACAASAGIHAALVSAHAGESQALGGLFAVSALLLIAVALVIEHGGGRQAVAVTALLLAALLAIYVVSRFAPLWPLERPEPVDAIGAVTKLFEAGGLMLAIGLLQTPRAAAKEPLASTKGVDP